MPFDRVVFALFNELVSVDVLGEGHGVRSGRLCEQVLNVRYYLRFIAHLSSVAKRVMMTEVLKWRFKRFAVFVLGVSPAVRGYTLGNWGVYIVSEIIYRQLTIKPAHRPVPFPNRTSLPMPRPTSSISREFSGTK